jgi:acyl-CoA synthetase (AMP-forming)/AMP-acid ligase II
MVGQCAQRTPNKAAFYFLGQPTSFGDLWEQISSAGRVLLGHGLKPTARVLIALPNGPDFFSVFYGAQWAGGIAVPVFPNVSPEYIERLAVRYGAHSVIAEGKKCDAIRQAATNDLRVFGPNDLARVDSGSRPPIAEIACLQLTSGSTGEAKAVALTHRSLLKNIRQIIAGMEISPAERFVSWLPVYHDMGLILKTMVPMAIGADTYLLPTSLGDVERWLAEIERIGGTLTAAPDFAWRLCIRRPRSRSYDLSSLRVALNAAESVRADTIRSFEAAFNLRNVMTAGYGLAEATVGVSMTRPGTSPRVDAHGNLSVGFPFPEVKIEIRHAGKGCQVGTVGEIHVRTAAKPAGYFQDEAASRATFGDDGFVATGDFGYVDADGELFVLGRNKNVIKIAGRTLAPREVEEAAELHPLVRFAAAVGIDRKELEGEQIVVFAEIRTDEVGSTAFESIARDIVGAVRARTGISPIDVVLLKPRTLPLTHNGKVQHHHLRRGYLDGVVGTDKRVAYALSATRP